MKAFKRHFRSLERICFNLFTYAAAAAAVTRQMKMTHDDRYMMTVSDDYCVILWKVIDRDGRGKKVDRELAYSQEILIPKSDLQEKVCYCHHYHCCWSTTRLNCTVR